MLDYREFDSSFEFSGEEDKLKKRENKLRQILSPEARSRLSTLRLVKPDLVTLAEDWVLELVEKNRIKVPVSDENLKQILIMINGKKREPRITRK